MNKAKNIVFFIIILLSADLLANDAQWLAQSRAMDILVLHITTKDGILPTCDTIWNDTHTAVGITNNDKVEGQLIITRLNDTLYNSGPYVKKESGMKFRVRGNTSAANNYKKKPYKISLEKKQDLLFRGNANYKDKDWLLLRADNLQNLTGHMISRLMGCPWVPGQQYVLLFINGECRGEYILSESIKQNEKARINVDADQGCIFEYDAYWWNEDYYIPTNNWWFNYTLKYPDVEDMTSDQETNIKNQIATFESSIQNNQSVEDIIDLQSFARWLWIQDIMCNTDYAGSNMYFTIFDSKSPIQMACPWDFDATLISTNEWAPIHNYFWFKDLFDMQPSAFQTTYSQMYYNLVPQAIDSAIHYLQNLSSSTWANMMDSVVEIDSKRWWPEYPSMHKQIEHAIDFLSARKTWLVQHHSDTNIATPLDPNAENRHIIGIYTPFGQKTCKPAKGINIIVYSDGTVQKIQRNED